MDFDLSHPVVANFAEHVKSVKAAERRRRVPGWMRTIGLTPTPELEAVISLPLTSLPGHSLLSHIPLSECQERVLSVGSVLLQLLAVRKELREPLNLDGDILDDLNTGRAVSCLTDSPRALSVIFGAIPFNEGTTAKLTSQMLKFNSAHIIYDPEFCPPTFRRKDPSIFTPTTAIPVMLNLKRKGSGKIEGEKSAKKAKNSKKSGTAPSKKKERVEQANGTTTMRTLRS
jgi:hypothetical protein